MVYQVTHRDDVGAVIVQISEHQGDAHFADAMIFKTEEFTPEIEAALDAMVQKRIDDWVAALTSPPVVEG